MNSATFRSNVQSSQGRGANGAKRAHSERAGGNNDRGFTLVELLIVITIIPVIIGALSAGLLAVFSLQNSVSNRLANSSDSQIVSANYIQDVQAAQRITTANMATAPGCGTASETQILGLEWDNNQTVVSYVVVQGGSNYLLERNSCAAGHSTTPTTTVIVSYNMPPPTTSPVTILPSSSSTAATAGWAPAQPVTGVTLNIVEPGSSGGSGGAPFAYTLVAVPSAGAPQGQQGSPTATTTSCNFALAGTGTYASSLCFVDFAPLNIAANQTSAISPGSMRMTVGIRGGYTLSFTISITNEANAPVDGYRFPTWGGSFMGNASNGVPFYSGVGCAAGTSPTYVSGGTTYGTASCTYPALYQTVSNNSITNVITIGSISLLDPEGVAATGWQLVSGDAESTDPREVLTWTSNQAWSQIANGQGVGSEGDACNAPAGNGGPGIGGSYILSGIGSNTVTCKSSWQDSSTTPRTGTVMLETPTPTTVSVQMQGAGLQGVFFGLMLPA
jgi:prepilin-type N-terminal cleavage/methylation domain-containing protein